MIFAIKERDKAKPIYIYKKPPCIYYTDGKIKGVGFKVTMWGSKQANT